MHEAARAEQDGINAGFPPALRLARSAQQSGRYVEAKSIAANYLQIEPDDLIAMTVAAEAELALGNADEADSTLRLVIERCPTFPPATMLLAKKLIAELRLRDAATTLEALLILVPRELSAKRYLADVLTQVNDTGRAASLYKEVLDVQPNSSADQFKCAQILRYAGARAESIKALRRSIELSPEAGHAWWPLVHHFPEDLTDDDETQLRAAVSRPGILPDDRALLQAALSVLEHRRGNHRAAFAAVEAAKAYRASSSSYDPDALSIHVDELIAAYTPEVFERFKPLASSDSSPIFIVGLPRSGSTLLERILGQHSKVEALGEIPVLPRVVAMGQPEGTASYRSLMPVSLTGEKLHHMSDWYLDRSAQYRRSDSPRFTDKYNGNWIRAGLIRLMFPNAKILDIRREPLDCCWAVFRSFLVNDYANDLRHLGRYFVDYVRYMEAMAAASPGGILTVNYEDLVGDVEGHTRRILDFLGLGFERGCVDFHLSKAAVRTPSSEQVRRPINSEAIGSSGPYRPWLQPLIDELEAGLGSLPRANCSSVP